jgi:hypothetical protein
MESEWRGRVQHLGSGQGRYFNEIGKIIEFIGDHLSKEKGETQIIEASTTHAVEPRIHYPLKRRIRRGSPWLDKRPMVGALPSRQLANNSSSKPYSSKRRFSSVRKLLRVFVWSLAWLAIHLKLNAISSSRKFDVKLQIPCDLSQLIADKPGSKEKRFPTRQNGRCAADL